MRHFRKHFVDWQENKLSTRMQNKIEEHLRKCTECRKYFRSMERFFQKVDTSILPELQPGPYDITRILARATETESREKLNVSSWSVKLSYLYVVVLAFTVLVGMWLGKGLVQSPSESELYNFAVQQREILTSTDTHFSHIWVSLEAELENEN